MLALRTDHPDPMAELRRLGVDARLAWYGDHDSAALVFVPTDRENLHRLDRWLKGRPPVAVAELAA